MSTGRRRPCCGPLLASWSRSDRRPYRRRRPGHVDQVRADRGRRRRRADRPGAASASTGPPSARADLAAPRCRPAGAGRAAARCWLPGIDLIAGRTGAGVLATSTRCADRGRRRRRADRPGAAGASTGPPSARADLAAPRCRPAGAGRAAARCWLPGVDLIAGRTGAGVLATSTRCARIARPAPASS
jgi:hypothetical protein